jgi:hypothetical protein
MSFLPAGKPLSIEVTYQDPGLNVGMRVFDDSGVTPTLVGSTIAMLNWEGNSYRAQIASLTPGRYLIRKAVYTDNTLAVIDPSYSESSEAIRVDDLAGLVLDALIASYQNVGSVGEAISASGTGGGGSTFVDLEAELDLTQDIEGELFQ